MGKRVFASTFAIDKERGLMFFAEFGSRIINVHSIVSYIVAA